MKKLLLFTVFLTCFTGSQAMEDQGQREITLKASNGNLYHLDENMVSRCQTLLDLMEDVKKNDGSVIPLPDSITVSNFDHVYEWLKIINSYTDEQNCLYPFSRLPSIDAIIQYTFDYDLRSSVLQSLIDIVVYLDIQVPDLLDALNERKSMIKVVLQDSSIWIAPEKLKNCNAFANLIEDENDDAIELNEMTREVFESIIGISKRKQEQCALKNSIFPENLIEEMIQADKIGNEVALNKAIKDLQLLIINRLSGYRFNMIAKIESFDMVADALKDVFQKIPDTVQYLIFEECFKLISIYESKLEGFAKDNELTLQQKVEFILFYRFIVDNYFYTAKLPDNIKLDFYKKLLSLKRFYALNSKWQTILIDNLPVSIKERIKNEFRCRKIAVNKERGLVKLCKASAIKKWENDINMINYITFDVVVERIEKDLNKLPQEVAEELCASLIEHLIDTIKFGPIFTRVLVNLNQLKITQRDILSPLLFVVAFYNDKTENSMVELVTSKTYKNFSEAVKEVIVSTNPTYFEKVFYVANTSPMLVKHPFVGDIVLGGVGGFSAGILSQAFLKKMSNPNLLSQIGLGAARVAWYYGCYKLALMPHTNSIMYHVDFHHELANLEIDTRYTLRIISAALGAYLGAIIGAVL